MKEQDIEQTKQDAYDDKFIADALEMLSGKTIVQAKSLEFRLMAKFSNLTAEAVENFTKAQFINDVIVDKLKEKGVSLNEKPAEIREAYSKLSATISQLSKDLDRLTKTM